MGSNNNIDNKHNISYESTQLWDQRWKQVGESASGERDWVAGGIVMRLPSAKFQTGMRPRQRRSTPGCTREIQ